MPLYPSLTTLDPSASAEVIHSAPNETVLDGTCEVPVYKSGVLKNVTTQDIADLGGGGGLPTQTGNNGKFLTTDGSAASWATLAGGGDALVANPLSQFAATTSLELKNTISDETGSGALVFGTSPALTTPTGIVKGDVGLGSVDNTSDAGKPVSTAQQTALDLKANLASPTFTGLVTIPTGDGTTAPLNFPAGTLKATPADGDIESDGNCLYGTTDAGNRGYIPVRHFIRCNATRTLPNDSNLNAIFDSPTNGRLTLETGTYLFEAVIGIKSMSATSGNAAVDVLGAGTATVDDWLYAAIGKDGTLISVAAVLGTMPVIKSTPASMFTAGTGAEMWFTLKGSFTVTGSGTLIPSIDQVTGAAAIVQIGSYFSCERVGSTSVVSVGQWD